MERDEKPYPEYELAGIETIARGVCVCDGELLLCRAKNSKSSYLPGGHIEFGERARDALCREIAEELGVNCSTGNFLGVLENSFEQHGKPHAEINLLFELKFEQEVLARLRAYPEAREGWIEFFWCALDNLESAGLLPESLRVLEKSSDCFFDI